MKNNKLSKKEEKRRKKEFKRRDQIKLYEHSYMRGLLMTIVGIGHPFSDEERVSAVINARNFLNGEDYYEIDDLGFPHFIMKDEEDDGESTTLQADDD